MTPGGSSPHQPWFHIGTLEVTTTWLVVLLSAVTLIANAFAGNRLVGYLALLPDQVLSGWLWTLLTWPLAFPVQGIFWSALTIALFWYFGSDIERSRLGKSRFLWMLVIWTLILGGLQTGLSVLLGRPEPLYDLGLIEMMVVLLWIGEWPTRRFIFNIPAWGFGIFLVAINFLQYVGQRRVVMLLTFVIGLVLCAMVAKAYGMLSEHHWIPGGRTPSRARAAKPAKPAKRQRRSRRGGSGQTVVAGPWSGAATSAESADERRMDELLEKIHAHGADSLTPKEKKELLQLRERRRRRS